VLNRRNGSDLKDAEKLRLKTLVSKVNSDPEKVLKRLKLIKKGISSGDPSDRARSGFILSTLAITGFNEEVRDLVRDISAGLKGERGKKSRQGARITCPGCGTVRYLDNPVFPQRTRCEICGREVITDFREDPSGHAAHSSLYWNLFFLYEMARLGHRDYGSDSLEALERLKGHEDVEIRKMARMCLILHKNL
jgi:hypothetical protein